MSAPGRGSPSVDAPLDLLASGRLRLVGPMPNASNHTFLAEVGEGDRPVLAVYKPRAGETPLWDFPDGTLCRREVAAHRLAAALGWPSVPPTILRDGPHGPGSVQLFIEADPREHFFTMREERLKDFAAVAAFDVIANNADRKSGHCLLAMDGRIWVVDHGVCFSEDPKLRTVIWDFAGDPVPAGLLEDVRRVAGEVRSGDLGAELAELLSKGEMRALARRAEALGQAGAFPSPGLGRPYPWPPV